MNTIDGRKGGVLTKFDRFFYATIDKMRRSAFRTSASIGVQCDGRKYVQLLELLASHQLIGLWVPVRLSIGRQLT